MADTESLKNRTEEWVMGRRNRSHGLLPLREVLARCGNPQTGLPIVHVAGTNGKGSTVNYLKDILMAEGKKVGTFTSPHLIAHRDRIRINDVWIPEEVFAGYVSEYKALIEQYDLGMFEIDTLITFLYMQKEKVDVLILETGIGGRLDNTNVIENPLLEIITSVSYDHTQLLGSRLEQIAFEKAGIIKPYSHVIVAGVPEKAMPVIRYAAARRHAAVIPSFAYWKKSADTFLTDHDLYRLSTIADYQKQNACAALRAGWFLGADIHSERVKAALYKSAWAGRFETVSDDPEVIIDGAHNREGMEALCRTLKEMKRPVYAVFSALRDKEVTRMAAMLKEQTEELYITRFENTRMDSASHMQKLAGVYCENWQEAIQKAMQKAGKEGVVVITGSLYFISEVRQYFSRETQRQSMNQ